MHNSKAFALFSLILLSSFAGAVGISPASINANNVMRGGYAEASFKVFNTDTHASKIILTPVGPQANWVKIQPSDSVLVDAKSSADVKAIIAPPSDAANGIYYVFIRAVAIPQAADGEGVGAQVAVGVESRLSITIADNEVLEVNIDAVNVKDVEETSQGTIFVTLRNGGNVRLTPTFKVDIKDRNNAIIKSFDATGSEVLPTTTKEVSISSPTQDLQIGTYSATVSTLIKGQVIDTRTVQFNVLEIGGLRKFGEFTSLEATPKEPASGELVKITAKFKNTGAIGLNAKFSGEIYLDQALVATVSSDEFLVEKDEEKELNVFFKPEKSGSYSIRGRVLYSKRTTDEKEATILVKTKEDTFPWAYAIGAIVLLALLVFALNKMNKPPASPAVKEKARRK